MSPDTDQTVVDEEAGEGGGQSAGLHGGGAVSHCYISTPGSRTMICNVTLHPCQKTLWNSGAINEAMHGGWRLEGHNAHCVSSLHYS